MILLPGLEEGDKAEEWQKGEWGGGEAREELL